MNPVKQKTLYGLKKRGQNILKQVEYERARRKNHVNEKQEKQRNKFQNSLLSHLFLGNSRKLKGSQVNSRELMGTQRNSMEVLLEVMEGKNQGKGQRCEISQIIGKKENIDALYECLKILIEGLTFLQWIFELFQDL